MNSPLRLGPGEPVPLLLPCDQQPANSDRVKVKTGEPASEKVPCLMDEGERETKRNRDHQILQHALRDDEEYQRSAVWFVPPRVERHPRQDRYDQEAYQPSLRPV